MNFEDFIKQSSSISYIYKITPEVYYSFQRCSNDFNPLHTDEQWAKDKGFPNCVMYGNILNAFISHFVGMLLPSRNVIIQTQDIAFHKPVFLNDEIKLESTIEEVSEAVSIVNYKFKFTKIIKTESKKSSLVAKGHVQIGFLEH